MTLNEFLSNTKELYDAGKITKETFDSLLINAEAFVDEEDYDDRLPSWYAEVEYTSEQLESDPIAIEGAKFDDMNYRHYMER